MALTLKFILFISLSWVVGKWGHVVAYKSRFDFYLIFYSVAVWMVGIIVTFYWVVGKCDFLLDC